MKFGRYEVRRIRARKTASGFNDADSVAAVAAYMSMRFKERVRAEIMSVSDEGVLLEWLDKAGLKLYEDILNLGDIE